MLQRLASDVRPYAESRGLFVTTPGPDQLEVEGDPVKVRRIAQNLLLNALKSTRSGGVTVEWDDGTAGDRKRWHSMSRTPGRASPPGPAHRSSMG